MKKFLTALFALFSAVFLLTNNSIYAEGPMFTDRDQLLTYIKSVRDAAAPGEDLTIEFSCSDELYALLSEHDFRELPRLMIRAGITPEIRYSHLDAAGTITIYEAQITDTRWAECESEEQVREFISGLPSAAQGFALLLTPELLTDLLETGNLYWFAALNGINDMSLSYSLTSNHMLAKDLVRFEYEHAVVHDQPEFASVISSFAERNLKEFFIVFTPELYEKITGNNPEMRALIGSSRLSNYSGIAYDQKRTIAFDNVEYTNAPREICRSVDDVSEALLRMGAIGAAEFELVIPEQNLFETLYADQFALLHQIEANAGLVSCSLSYSPDSGRLSYSNAVITKSAPILETLADAASAAAAQIAAGAADVHLFCTPELFTALLGDLSDPGTGRHTLNRIEDIITQNGISEYELTASNATHLISIHIIHQFPGMKIVKAVRSGDDSGLTGLELQLMNAALAAADSVRDQDPLTRAMMIHDMICGHVVYTDDDSTGEDDNAIGAILNGKANCDGYTDAFYLIGSLAGLNIRYQYGNSVEMNTPESLSSVTHIWNLLELDGEWRMVDVTWDDEADGRPHVWFNAGLDVAERVHIWNRDMSVELAPFTERTAHAENEFYIRTEQELRDAVDTAARQAFPDFYIIFEDPAMADRRENTAQAVADRTSGSMIRYTWNEPMAVMGFHDMTWK